MQNDIYTKLSQSLVDGDPDACVEFTKEALAAGLEPMAIFRQGLMPGMSIVGEKFGSGEYFLPDLIIAADGMQQAMALLEPELRARFLREARTAGRLSHKNIVTIYDLGEESGKAYMAMEFLDGEDLGAVIGRRGKMTLEQRVRMMLEVTQRLGGTNYVLWGGREGYDTLLNTDLRREGGRGVEIEVDGARHDP